MIIANLGAYLFYAVVLGGVAYLTDKNGGDSKLTFLILILALMLSGGVK